MSDTEIVDPGTTSEQEQAVADLETPAEKPAKIVKEPHACLCSSFQLIDPTDAESVYQPECGATTKSVFAQGHDARLVSFLVDGHRDGLKIQQVVSGEPTSFGAPAQAVAHISEPLRIKAEKATQNMLDRQAVKEQVAKAREAKKAERQAEAERKKAAKEAAKAMKDGEPKATGAEVAAGSVTGDVPALADNEVRIKVGRWEYTATKLEDGGVSFTNGKGEVETRAEGDGYTVIQAA